MIQKEEKRETMQLPRVADFFSSKAIFQIRLDEERGQLIFVLFEKENPAKKAVVVPTSGELEMMREALRVWKESQGWKNSEEFLNFWNYVTQERNCLVHAYERDGKEVIKRFGFVVLNSTDRIRFNNLGFMIRTEVDGKTDANLFFPLSPVQVFEMEYVIAKYKRMVNEAEIRKRAEKLAKYLQKKERISEYEEEIDVDEKALQKTKTEVYFDFDNEPVLKEKIKKDISQEQETRQERQRQKSQSQERGQEKSQEAGQGGFQKQRDFQKKGYQKLSKFQRNNM